MADRKCSASDPALKARVTSQISQAFLGCSTVCKAYAQAKPRHCQGQRGFGWYLNFKATLGALPISRADVLTHPFSPTIIPGSSDV